MVEASGGKGSDAIAGTGAGGHDRPRYSAATRCAARIEAR
jgi:hypothetical protein